MADSSMVSGVLPLSTCPQSDGNADLDLDVNITGSEDSADDVQCADTDISWPPWDCLPPELLAKIFCHLQDADKESVESTCQAWCEACQNPALWHTQMFAFTGDNCLQTVHQACRTIQRKGYLLRNMTLKIGIPSLPQAWIISQSVQQLLEFITRHPASRYIQRLTINRLDFFKHWRFFTLSKRHLADVDLTQCGLSADNGMRILRALSNSPSRYTMKQLFLHDFFHSRYQATLGSRFGLLLTSFPALRHLSVDARHVDSSFLLSLVNRRILRRLTLHFESFPPREVITEKVWIQVREIDPDLDVTFVFGGRIPFEHAKNVLVPSVPLTEFEVNWPRAYRQSFATHQQLAALLNRVALLYSAILERFRVRSNIRATEETELALLRVANDCRRLVEFKVNLKLSESVLTEIRSKLLGRSQHIRVRLLKKKKLQCLPSQFRHRSRGSH
ncbi:F-box only protein 39 [Plakobranchus ocellatus]|uniref:F-box only protein 39 n=1 Tax=Plakobranchus ocellatus TaxID=259542 RepID=A0AAV3Y0J3_9GAST|nr:F-box only protein 39 [Plakobranchus ocellatus]